MKVGFELTGRTALLIHADDVEKQDYVTEWQNDPKNKNLSQKGDDRSPAWKWMSYTYSNGECLTISQDNIMACLRDAGSMVTVKGQGKKSYKSLTQTGILLAEEHYPLLVNGKPIPMSKLEPLEDELDFTKHKQLVESLGFSLYIKRARVGASKHVRVRPRLNDWSVKGELETVGEDISLDTLTQLFDLAGRYKGLCDWRPSSGKPGPFGAFTSELKVVKR